MWSRTYTSLKLTSFFGNGVFASLEKTKSDPFSIPQLALNEIYEQNLLYKKNS